MIEKDNRFTFRVSKENKEKFIKIAKKNRKVMSKLFNEFVESYIKKNKKLLNDEDKKNE